MLQYGLGEGKDSGALSFLHRFLFSVCDVLADEIGADGYSVNAVKAVKLAKKLGGVA